MREADRSRPIIICPEARCYLLSVSQIKRETNRKFPCLEGQWLL